MEDLTQLEPVARLRRDLRQSAALLDRNELRYLVDLYYQIQKSRIRAAHHARTNDEQEEPHALVAWTSETMLTIERGIKSAMQLYSESHRETAWALSVHGIGPILSAGLYSYIDPERQTTVGKLYAFAGIAGKDQKRPAKGETWPYSTRLKTLTWKASDSFVKQRNNPKDYYGAYYEKEKLRRQEKNTAGDYAELARKTLEERKFKDKKTREVYESGRLPDGRIENQARRYAVKLFLSHFWSVCWEVHHDRKIETLPYAIAHLGHTKYIPPPEWSL